MAKMVQITIHERNSSKTSIGKKPSLCKMNKNKRRSYKAYRGQGKK